MSTKKVLKRIEKWIEKWLGQIYEERIIEDMPGGKQIIDRRYVLRNGKKILLGEWKRFEGGHPDIIRVNSICDRFKLIQAWVERYQQEVNDIRLEIKHWSRPSTQTLQGIIDYVVQQAENTAEFIDKLLADREEARVELEVALAEIKAEEEKAE